MNLKKTITREPIIDAIHKTNYICLQDGIKLQIRVDAFKDGKKIDEEFIKTNVTDLPESYQSAIDNLEKETTKYLKTLDKWVDAEEILETKV